jgi:DNA-binding NtrC family response regulator
MKPRATLLIVDDNAAVLAVRSMLFDAAGLDVIAVMTLEEAFDHLSNSSIDGLLVDMNLVADDPSDLSGLNVARQSRSLDRTRPVFGFSGVFRLDELPEETRERFTDFFLKGVSRAALENQLQAITDACNSHFLMRK